MNFVLHVLIIQQNVPDSTELSISNMGPIFAQVKFQASKASIWSSIKDVGREITSVIGYCSAFIIVGITIQSVFPKPLGSRPNALRPFKKEYAIFICSSFKSNSMLCLPLTSANFTLRISKSNFSSAILHWKKKKSSVSDGKSTLFKSHD